ncbi:MAG TPA: glycoside hydrolase family 30 beta sandwich domain-containing protein [Polyangiaceae bacterium]|nr:glycoside hydrolase family 30 beta sandwich domain-containing protein [Polyangiaceae bacterium]
MTQLPSLQAFERASISSLALVLAALACDSGTSDSLGGRGGSGAGGVTSSSAGSPAHTTGATGSVAGASNGTAGGSGGVSHAGAPGASGGVTGSSAGAPQGTGATGNDVHVPAPVPLPPLVTSAPGAYWKTDGMLVDSTAAATVTVNETTRAQKWDGFGAAFNELGWSFLATSDLQQQAMKLLFSASDGAAFAWGRIPIGASDYATSRYTLDDTGTDVTPDSTEGNRPAADLELKMFSLTRDSMKLIPYIKAAQAVKSDLRFWASPWTPPVWMKTGYKKNSGADSSKPAKVPSYFDGGSAKNDDKTLTAYAQYYKKFIEGYQAQHINIELVSPQNEPGYDQNYPSCLWDATTYTTWIGKYLGPTMSAMGVKLMLGTLSNASDGKDGSNAAAALADSTAKSFLAVIGAQWGMLDQSKLSPLNSNLPIWATEHKCGNYPWCTADNPCTNPTLPNYVSSQAPNDQAYGVESWGYIRDAIKTVKVTAYNAWNMVLDKNGLGIDTTREWKQNTLLIVDSGKITPTPTYYVFRHLSQYVMPGAFVIGTTGGDAVAFENPDGSLVAVMFNSGAANANYVVAIGGKKFQFAMPSNGWATVKYKP